MEKHQYNKGEYVIFGTNGICYIEDVAQLDFSRDKRLYYILKQENTKNSVLYIPVDNDDLTSKMRYIFSKEDIDLLLDGAKGKEIEWKEDKNARAAYFHTVLSAGLEEELLLMISCIYLRKKYLLSINKKLPNADETVLQAAEKIVREELSYSLHLPPEEVGKYIRDKLGIPDETDGNAAEEDE